MPRRTLNLSVAVVAMLVASTGAAFAAAVDEVEGNDSIAHAQNIDEYFSLDHDPDIGHSTTVPHATVNGTGNGTYDFYSFTVSEAGAGSVGLLDVDGAMYSFDSWLSLYNSSGALIGQNDDAGYDPGTAHPYDSYMAYAFPTAGTYYISVSRYPGSNPVPHGGTYRLHVSLPHHQSVDTTAPQLTLPADMTQQATGSDGAVASFTASASDETDGSVPVACSPASGTVFPLGTTQVSCSASDGAGNTARGDFDVTVLYGFDGFFAPLDNGGVYNKVKAGRAVPTKFSLSGDMGLDILAAASPASQRISCDSSAAADPLEQTVTAGGSSLSYDATTGVYNYVWKTSIDWAGSCRLLTVTLQDGTRHSARFAFTK